MEVSTSTGESHSVSTEQPSTSDEESSVHDEVPSDESRVSTATSKRTRENDSGGCGLQTKQLKVTIVNMVKVIEKWCSARNKRFAAEAEYYAAKTEYLRSRTIKSKTTEQAPPDPYSCKACVEIINGMNELSDEVYIRAINAFLDADTRKAFLLMPEARRLEWLHSL